MLLEKKKNKIYKKNIAFFVCATLVTGTAIGTVTSFVMSDQFHKSKASFMSKASKERGIRFVSTRSAALNGEWLESSFVGIKVSHLVDPVANGIGFEELPFLEREHKAERLSFTNYSYAVTMSYSGDGMPNLCEEIRDISPMRLFEHQLVRCGRQADAVSQTYVGYLKLGPLRFKLKEMCEKNVIPSRSFADYPVSFNLSYKNAVTNVLK